MDKEILIELIKIIPQSILYVVIMVVVIMFYRPIVRRLLPRMSEFKVFGVEGKLLEDRLEKAAEQGRGNIPAVQRNALLSRIERHKNDLRHARLLWIDDNPGSLQYEQEILTSLGLVVEFAKGDDVALTYLRDDIPFEIIISDIERNGNPKAGITFLNTLHEKGIDIPTIFYISYVDRSLGTPPYAYAITDRPNELIHLVIDLLERRPTKFP